MLRAGAGLNHRCGKCVAPGLRVLPRELGVELRHERLTHSKTEVAEHDRNRVAGHAASPTKQGIDVRRGGQALGVQPASDAPSTSRRPRQRVSMRDAEGAERSARGRADRGRGRGRAARGRGRGRAARGRAASFEPPLAAPRPLSNPTRTTRNPSRGSTAREQTGPPPKRAHLGISPSGEYQCGQ